MSDSRTVAELAKTHKCSMRCELSRGVLPDGVYDRCLMTELLGMVDRHEQTIAALRAELDSLKG